MEQFDFCPPDRFCHSISKEKKKKKDFCPPIVPWNNQAVSSQEKPQKLLDGTPPDKLRVYWEIRILEVDKIAKKGGIIKYMAGGLLRFQKDQNFSALTTLFQN